MDGKLPKKICFAEYELDTPRRRLLRGGEPLALNAKTFDLLLFLAENNGRTISKEEILDAVWPGQFVEEANLSVQISALRRALGEKKEAPRFLITVPGKGYQFVADVEQEDDEIVIEKHSVSQVTIEREDDFAKAAAAALEIPSAGRSATARAGEEHGGTNRSRLYFAAAVGLVFALAAAGYYWWRSAAADRPFAKLNFSRLTNSGRVVSVALSPDGKYFAYVLGESEGNSLWIQQVGTASSIRLLAPVRAEFGDLTFSADGAFVYYNLFFGDKTDNELYRIPSLGGVAEPIPGVIAHSVAFAPDGKSIAYIQPDSESNRNYLVVADPLGANQRTIAAKPHPVTFIAGGSFVAWSPGGGTIAAVVNDLKEDESVDSVVLVGVADGAETPLSIAPLKHVDDLKWLSDGSGLLLSGRENEFEPDQIWFASATAGGARRLTNDLNSYYWIDPSASGKSFIALQTTTTNTIHVGAAGSGDFREIAREVGALSPLVWTPDGEIVFRSSADGTANLWKMDRAGGNRRQLTIGAHVNYRGLCATADGKYLVFVSWRGGKSNLWRADADGKNLVQLTNGEADAYPVCLPDTLTVVFQRGILSRPTLWKVSIDGGEPVRVTDFSAKWAAVSPDGGRLSFFQMIDEKWRFGFVSPDGRRENRLLDVPPNLRESFVHWSHDGESIFYIETVGNTGNIFALPVAGGPSVPLTNFASQEIANFGVAPDGRTIAAARTLSLSDVVLVTEAPATED